MVIVVCLLSYCAVLLEISEVKIRDLFGSFASLIMSIYCTVTVSHISILAVGLDL